MRTASPSTSTPTVEEEYEAILEESKMLKGPMGAIAFAVLEMFKRGGMGEKEIALLHERMNTYFMAPTNNECNAICKMVETRLKSEKRPEDSLWYQPE